MVRGINKTLEIENHGNNFFTVDFYFLNKYFIVYYLIDYYITEHIIQSVDNFSYNKWAPKIVENIIIIVLIPWIYFQI